MPRAPSYRAGDDPASTPPARPAVLLEHALPDGSRHWDWLIQRGGGPDATLLSFRVRSRIDDPRVVTFEADLAPDHRAHYLAHEGEVSGGRGRVRRVATGSLAIEREDADMVVLRGAIGDAHGVFRGVRAGETWRFERVARD